MSNDVIEKLDAIEKKISQQLAELIAAARRKEAPEIWAPQISRHGSISQR